MTDQEGRRAALPRALRGKNKKTLSFPTQLGGLEIVRRLGAGGMAEVFVAKKRGAEGTYKILVLKRILPAHVSSRRFRSMFVEEAQLATRLNHPNIVQVYEFQDHGDEGLQLSMEYVEGPDLGRLMSAAKAKGTRVPPWVSAYVIAEAAKGLNYAHERKEGDMPLDIVHRDVSPQNILLSYEGAVKIADFGIASANLFREESGVIKGKFGYMSPEQARGEKVDRRSDIYSLGCILHELITGRHLHGSLNGDALLEAVRSGVVEPPSTFVRDVPADLENVIMRALSRDPNERFSTARDMATAITRLLFQRQELTDGSTIEATIAQLRLREDALAHLPHPSVADDPSIPHASEVPPPLLSASPLSSPRSRSRAAREIRHVAVFTLIIHGWDELRAQTDASNFPRIVELVQGTLDDIAYKHGAHFTWQSARDARAIVGLMANPSRAAADAAWLALDVQEAIAGTSEDYPVLLRASIAMIRGIASGERDKLGHLIHHELEQRTISLAEAIGSSVPAGKVWVAGGLYRLIKREFRWGDAPSLDLPAVSSKTGTGAMRLYALERPLSREERLAELSILHGELVGREAEMGDLHAAYHQAVSEPGVVVSRAIVGEMGIGKTALVSALLSELPPDACVLRVEGNSTRRELPFELLCDLIREIIDTAPGTSTKDVEGRLADVLGSLSEGAGGQAVLQCLTELLTGDYGESGEAGDAAYKRELIYTGLRRLLTSLAARQPVLLVVEAMQAADRPSLEVLARFLRRKDRLPILVLLIARPDERLASVLEGVVRIELGGLPPVEQMRLVATRLGVDEGVSEACADLVARVAGNPFFLLETVDALMERGLMQIREQSDGRTALVRVDRHQEREALPSTLEQLLLDRLRELPPEERAVVEWLSVAGGPLDQGMLLRLGELPGEEPLSRLLARGVCDRKGGELDVRHLLTRDVAYRALDMGDRTLMHKRLGEELSHTALAKGMSSAIVARHLARGEAKDAAAHYYLEAAFAARVGYEPKLSIRYYRRALLLLDEDDRRRLAAYESLETLYRSLGRNRERLHALTELRRLSRSSAQPKWVGLALCRTARLDLDQGQLARGLPAARKAQEVAQATQNFPLLVEAESILSEILRELGDMQAAIVACDRALEVAKTSHVLPRLRAEVLQSRGVLLRRVGRVREAVDCYAEAIAVFRKSGAKRQEARAKNALAFAMFVLERFEDAIALALASVSIDLAIGGRFQVARTLTNVGRSYARLGDIPRAQAYLRRAREAHERYHDQNARAVTLLVSAEVRILAGDLDAAHVFCADAAALNAITSNAYNTVHELIVRAFLARTRGDAGLASTIAAEARHAAEMQGLVSFHLIATAIEAVARVQAGEAHTGILLAQNASSSIEALQGSEFGIEIRALCEEAFRRASSPEADSARARAVLHVRRVANDIRDPRLQALFFKRQVVQGLLERTPTSPPEEASDQAFAGFSQSSSERQAGA